MAVAERTALVINVHNRSQFENHEQIYDYVYAKKMCGLLFDDDKTFYAEMKKYKEDAKKVRRIALQKGEEVAMPYYLEHKEAYERYQDMVTVEDAILDYETCSEVEDLGFFGKR